MKKVVNIEEPTEEKLFRVYVQLIQPILRLRSREVDVFAQLLYLNHKKSSLPDVDRFDLIFSTKYRKSMAIDLDIKPEVLQNCFSELRKKNLIVDNAIPKGYWVFPTDNTLEIIFNLKITNNE
tara:strand:+ start:22 stop:390 length:369 start_codon:yes stop_codon:yes gene_type:complete